MAQGVAISFQQGQNQCVHIKFPFILIKKLFNVLKKINYLFIGFNQVLGNKSEKRAVRTGALKVIVRARLENNMGSLSFGYFPLAVQRKVTRLQAKTLLSSKVADWMSIAK